MSPRAMGVYDLKILGFSKHAETKNSKKSLRKKVICTI